MKKLRICLISRYPPIPGGTSSTSYWMTRRLGKLGHRVYVVTDSLQGRLKAKNIDYPKELQPKNVKVYTTEGIEGLSALAIEVIKENNVDIIDARYLLPYGLSGLIAKTLTGKPLVMKHAGSDMLKYFDNPGVSRAVFGSVEEFRYRNYQSSKKEGIYKVGDQRK